MCEPAIGISKNSKEILLICKISRQLIIGHDDKGAYCRSKCGREPVIRKGYDAFIEDLESFIEENYKLIKNTNK